MKYRELGRTGWRVSEVGLGTWAMGGDKWGRTDDEASRRALHRAIDAGINFFDTADVYGDGHAETLIADVLGERDEEVFVATKAGRRQRPHTAEGYSKANLSRFVERSLSNLKVETIDLLQLHCPPTPVFADSTVYTALDELVAEGKIRHYGVSVETVAEAMTAIEHDGVVSVQIVFNAFRQKPIDEFLAAASARGVGVLARVPLASGLLTGKFTAESVFDEMDHRLLNREGALFDRGETFSGVDYETGLRAVDEMRALVPEGITLAQLALRWILMHPQVTSTIPGAKTTAQVDDNAAAAELDALSDSTMASIRSTYDRLLRAQIHPHW